MLKGDGNENGKKKNQVGLISKQKPCTCSTLTAAHFHLGGRYHFSYFHCLRYKIFMFFFQRNSSPLVFVSHSSSFSVIHISVDIKISRLCCYFFLEMPRCLKLHPSLR